MRADRLLAFLSLPLLGGCYASNVVAVGDRVVADRSALQDVVWRPAVAGDFEGLFESVEVTGDVAMSLRRVWYWFEANGRYSGAALVDGDDGIAFQTLVGSWELTPAGLSLDGGAPLAASASTGLLRMMVEGGSLVLRAAEWK